MKGSFVRHTPRCLAWYDWLDANMIWASLRLGGYISHTPESVFLVYNKDIDGAVEWRNGEFWDHMQPLKGWKK